MHKPRGPVPPLVLWPAPVLEAPCTRVTAFGTEDLMGVIEELRIRLGSLPHGQKGWGLAAPQIGFSMAVSVIRIPSKAIDIVMCNPVITQKGMKVRVMEGCLSVPGFFHTIERRRSCTVVYQDEQGKQLTLKAKGLLAQVVQHEVDHLQGILMLEYVHERQARRRAKRCVEELAR